MRSRTARASAVAVAATFAGVVAGILAAPASADTVRFGSDLTKAHDSNAMCVVDGCTAVQKAYGPQSGNSLPLRAPVGGVLTSWSVRSDDNGALYSVRVMRQASMDDTFTAAGTATAADAVPSGGQVVLTNPAALPIRAGDALGLTLGGDADGMPVHSVTSQPQDEVFYRSTALGDGASAPFTAAAPYHLLVQATITYCRVPNVAGFRLPAARAAIEAADCAVKVTKKPKKKKSKRGRVLSQGMPAGTTLDPGAEVAVVVGKKPKRKPRKK